MIISIKYTESFHYFALRAFSVPTIRNMMFFPFGKYISTLIWKYTAKIYTSILLEVTGLAEFIEDMPNEDANKALNAHNTLLNYMCAISSNKAYFDKNTQTKELYEIMLLIIEKTKHNMIALEDCINKDFSYCISQTLEYNDWSDAENDHWDNY